MIKYINIIRNNNCNIKSKCRGLLSAKVRGLWLPKLNGANKHHD